MKLEHGLSIPVPVTEAWRVLLDIERIAPCVPGATLTARDGDRYSGKIKVKLGPIGLTYGGTVTFLSQDEETRTAVLEATGRELRGGGTAKAVVTCSLTAAGEATDVLVETDLAITGKPAQFGRGALSEVAGALIGRFAANLAEELSVPSSTGGTGSGEPAPEGNVRAGEAVDATEPRASSTDAGLGRDLVPASGTESPTSGRAAEPIDLLGTAGGGVVKRIGPAAAGAALLLSLFLVRRLIGRRTDRPVP